MVLYIDPPADLNRHELYNWPPLRVYESDTGAQWLAVADLVYLEGELNYTWLHWANGRRILVPYTLKRVEARLPPKWFVRLHRHFMVNRQFIDRIDLTSTSPLCYLLTGTDLPISRRCWVVLRKQLTFHKSTW